MDESNDEIIFCDGEPYPRGEVYRLDLYRHETKGWIFAFPGLEDLTDQQLDLFQVWIESERHERDSGPGH